MARSKSPYRQEDPRKADVAEAFVSEQVGVPMSHESLLVLARLQSIADQLERAVIRLERQANRNEGEEEAESDAE